MAKVKMSSETIITREMERGYDENGRTEWVASDFSDLIENRSTLSATLSGMVSDGVVTVVGERRNANNRRINVYSLTRILDEMTAPEKPEHVNRPPIPEVKAPKPVERKPEVNASGEIVTSIPAHEFNHQDNATSAKLTGNRDPRKPQDPEAVAEMVDHIHKTSGLGDNSKLGVRTANRMLNQARGEEMAIGAPKQGTPEFDLFERDKRIERLEAALEKAIEQLNAKATYMQRLIDATARSSAELEVKLRSAIEKSNATNSGGDSAPNGDIEKDIALIAATLEKMIGHDHELHAAFKRMIRVGEQEKFHFSTGYMKGFMEGVKSGNESKQDEVITLEGKDALEFLTRLSQKGN